MINVEVVYAKPGQQYLLTLTLLEAITAKEAIEQSGILQLCPEIDLTQQAIGLFANIVHLDALLKDGDRVEIYRPLYQDPKTARLKRLSK